MTERGNEGPAVLIRSLVARHEKRQYNDADGRTCQCLNEYFYFFYFLNSSRSVGDGIKQNPKLKKTGLDEFSNMMVKGDTFILTSRIDL